MCMRSYESSYDTASHKLLCCLGAILGHEPLHIFALDLAAFVVGVEVEGEEGSAEEADGGLSEVNLQDVYH